MKDETLTPEEILSKGRALVVQFQSNGYKPIEAVLILASAIGLVIRSYDGDSSGMSAVAEEAIRSLR